MARVRFSVSVEGAEWAVTISAATAAAIQAIHDRSEAEGQAEALAASRLVEEDAPPAHSLDFTDFFLECAPRVHRWIARRCGSDRTVAEDLVQEVFFQAFRKWETVQHYGNPHGWVFMVAWQVVRRYRRRLRETADLPDLQDHRIGDAESLIDFDRSLLQLTAAQRKVAVLVLALEYTPAEAAQVLGLNESTVRSHLHRARLQIKKQRLIDGSDGEENR
jgi:RNA polymerase sigma-70 factor (ECF subfamily)